MTMDIGDIRKESQLRLSYALDSKYHAPMLLRKCFVLALVIAGRFIRVSESPWLMGRVIWIPRSRC
jgi:hypothetical protein